MPTLDKALTACGSHCAGCKVCALAAQHCLSLTDMAILVLIANSYSNEAIAKRVMLKPSALQSRILDLNQKLGTRSKLQLGLWAIRHKLVTNVKAQEDV